MGRSSFDVNIKSVEDETVLANPFIAVTRPSSDLNAACVIMDHGTVTADWSADYSSTKTQTSGYHFWITELSVVSDTDPTSELATQPIPFRIGIYDVTDSEWRWIGFGCIPNNTHFSFRTPIKITSTHQYRTQIQLGGATNLQMAVILNGYETSI